MEIGWRLGGDWVEIGWRLNSGGRVEKFGSGDQTVVLFFTSPYTFSTPPLKFFSMDGGWRLISKSFLKHREGEC